MAVHDVALGAGLGLPDADGRLVPQADRGHPPPRRIDRDRLHGRAVRRPPGAKPGEVTLSGGKTLRVRLADAEPVLARRR